MSAPEPTDAAVLVVDDEQPNIDLLEGFLAAGGFGNVTSTRSPDQVCGLVASVRPDIILLDLRMPRLDGFEVMSRLQEQIPPDVFLPIVVLTADITTEAKQRALAGGASDFLTKPLDGEEVLLRIRNLLRTRFLQLDQRDARFAAESSERRASFLAEASRVLSASFDYQTALEALARSAIPELADHFVIDLRDEAGGTARVAAAHADPDVVGPLRDAIELWGGFLTRDHPLSRKVREGHAVLIADVVSAPDSGELAETAIEHARYPAARSLICLPLVSSGRVNGELFLAITRADRQYGSQELELAEELARRVSLAVDNARLFHQAQEATAARDDILAVVAHDLRNPLNTVSMVLEALEETPEPDRGRHLEIARRSADRMNRLIQDLLEVARIESNSLRLESRPESIAPLLDEASSMLRPLAESRGIRLETAECEDLPPAMMDPARVLQVISNLVGNAIKFTPEGGLVQIRCDHREDGLRFMVRDTGPGIPPHRLSHIFGRFWQAGKADRRGIGLGLSIARGIVEGHGGRIWAESTVGEGTSFYFTLPAVDPLHRVRSVETLAGADGPLSERPAEPAGAPIPE